MEHYNPEDIKINNLKLLIHHLKNNVSPDAFDMNSYSNNEPEIKPYGIQHICGTSGCILGHAPEIIPPLPEHILNNKMYWTQYSKYVLGVTHNSNIWNFCFSPSWSIAKEHSTLEAAIARLEYVVCYGDCPRLYSKLTGEPYTQQEWFLQIQKDQLKEDEARMDIIGQNGNEGLHYNLDGNT